MSCRLCLKDHPPHQMCRPADLAALAPLTAEESLKLRECTARTVAEAKAKIAEVEAEKEARRVANLARVKKHRLAKKLKKVD